MADGCHSKTNKKKIFTKPIEWDIMLKGLIS